MRDLGAPSTPDARLSQPATLRDRHVARPWTTPAVVAATRPGSFVRPVSEALIARGAGEPGKRRWVALVVLCLGQLMIVLDSTIVNVALPPIQRDLRFTQANLTWVINAYLITFGGFLLLAGRIGDLIGRKKVFLFGVVVFTVASATCGLAPDATQLIVARFVQGIGAAITTSVIIAIIVTEFPGTRERGKAIGVFSFTASAGGSIGLITGGVLTAAINWHWTSSSTFRSACSPLRSAPY